MSSNISFAEQFQILLVLTRKDFWDVVVLHFLIMYLLLLLLVEDVVRLTYLRTSGRTEEFTLARPCVNLKKRKKVKSKSSCQ